MNKIILIIQREYLSRVKKKSFLVLTFLVPFLFVGMMALISYLAVNQDAMAEKKTVLVVDENGWFSGKLKNSPNMQFVYSQDNYTATKEKFTKSEEDFLLYIPSSMTGVQLLGKKKPSTVNTQSIEERINTVAQAHRLADAHIDSAVLANAQKTVHCEVKQLTDKGETDAHSVITLVIGMLCAIIIYMSLLLYGVQVMRGVIEEKISRIVEVVISSVKPYQLMMGKIIGVGMVGLTQFLLWIGLSIALFYVGGPILMKNTIKAKTEQVQIQKNMQGTPSPNVTAVNTPPKQDNEMAEMISSLGSINVYYILGCFLFYFLTGYLLYSAIFAAVGSAVDSETETQQFVLPVTLPLIFTFSLAQSVIVNNPDSTLSFWLSMIPFTSPIAMMIRIQFGVPAWQLAVSMLMMIAGFLFTVWVASRIYRVGILMYGKKASYRELAKWFRYKE